MKLVQVEKLVGGEVLAREIITSGYKIILGKGTVIKPEYISKLKELDILSVYVEENNNTNLMESAILKDEVKNDCLVKVREILQKHIYRRDQELSRIDQAASEVLANIVDDERVVDRVYEIKVRSFDVYEHCLSVCSLAILMSLRLHVSKEEIHEIGIASLLHDIGLLYITVGYNGKDVEKLPRKEQEEYKKHTVYGYSAVFKEDWISDNTKKMILFHHERVGGTGYPLHEKDLPVSYQILALAETFDELLCGVGCVPVKVYEAVEYIKMQRNHGFSSEVVDVLLQFVAVYPTGTKVRMSNGTIGVVVSQNESFPDRPKVKLLFDKDGEPMMQGEVTDLLKTLNLVITEVMDDQ